MERKSIATVAFAILLTAAGAAGDAAAQSRGRKVYNPVTKQYEIEHRPKQRRAKLRQPAETAAAFEQQPVAQPAFEPEFDFVEPVGCQYGCDCGDCLACGDAIGGCGCGAPPAAFFVAFESTFLKPRYENNVAFTVTESDAAATFESITDTEFDYDLEFSPRVFIGWRRDDGVGLRATWWRFEEAASLAAANPPANGFGSITHPDFGGVDISSVDPTDTFAAGADLTAYTIDLEATKETRFYGWDVGVAGGVRYAYAEQGYIAQLTDQNQLLLGSIDFRQQIEGFGPTLSLSAARELAYRIDVFCRGRGSILFGDGESTLVSGQSLTTANPATVTRTTNRDDLLSIAEIQFGFGWKARRRGGAVLPFVTVAMEGQIWNGAGTASSEDGDLGFFGFTSAFGVDW